tara:strand:- start:19329 stop:20915 length:1587 start_codon:yes stop_codon:yes gene_type:complete
MSEKIDIQIVNEQPTLSFKDSSVVLSLEDSSSPSLAFTNSSVNLSIGNSIAPSLALNGGATSINLSVGNSSNEIQLVATGTPGPKGADGSGGGGGSLNTEDVQDLVGAMFTGNTETRISVEYKDEDGTIDLVVDDMTTNTIPDATNVAAAGALMNSEVTNLAQVKSFSSANYATAAQGAKADSAQQPPSEGVFENGDKNKLDGIETGAEVNVQSDWSSSSGDNQILNKPAIPVDLDDLSDVDFSTSSPQVDQVLMFNGIKFVAADEGSTFAFVWNSVEYNNNANDITDTTTAGNIADTILIGSGNHITSSSVTLNFQNAVSSKFTSGVNGSDNLGLSTQAWSGSMTSRANLSFDQSNQRATASTGTINLPFPSNLSSTSYNRIKVRFQYDGSNKSNQLSYSYKNYMYLGKHTDDSPTNSELQSFQKKSFIDNGTSNTEDISAFGITLNGTSQHLQFWYPARITNNTPSFLVGESSTSLSGEPWTVIDSGNTISHINSAGFTEPYKGWKSPNPLSNSGGVSTWYVQVIF